MGNPNPSVEEENPSPLVAVAGSLNLSAAVTARNQKQARVPEKVSAAVRQVLRVRADIRPAAEDGVVAAVAVVAHQLS